MWPLIKSWEAARRCHSSFCAAPTPSAIGIKTADEIVGFYEDSSGVFHGFLLSGGTYTTVDFPGAACTEAIDINDTGEVDGLYSLKSDCSSSEGFLDNGGSSLRLNSRDPR